MLATAKDTYGVIAARGGCILPPDREAEYVIEMRRQAAMDILGTGATLPEPMVTPACADIAGAPIRVTVNHGRWVVDCPGEQCGGAQVAARNDHRFFCVTCGNGFVQGRWLAVTWPDDPDAIDRALSVRPKAFQNWHGEPLDVLLADNADPVNGL